jgi:hypothetical protein
MTVRGLMRLSRHDVGVLLEACWLLPAIEIGLRVLPLDALLRRLGGTAAVDSARAVDPRRAALLVDHLGALYPLDATCLKKSLVLLRILRRRGHTAELRLGVRQVDGTFASHAWVDCGDHRLLDDGEAAQFATLPIT